MKMHKSRIVLLSSVVLAVTFILGALTGAGILMLSAPHPMMGPPPGGEVPFHPLPFSELSLTEKQHKQIMKILETHKPNMDKIFKESFPKIKKETDQIEKEIRKILDAEQKQLFDEMIEKREQDMKDGKPPHVPGKPPHIPGKLPF